MPGKKMKSKVKDPMKGIRKPVKGTKLSAMPKRGNIGGRRMRKGGKV